MNNSSAHLRTNANRYPTSKHDYTLTTPMMRDVLDIVTHEVDKMEIGVSIISTSRFGKTKMLAYLDGEIRRTLPSVTVARVIMTTRSMDRDRKYFAHLLGAINAEDDLNGDGDQVRVRIEQYFLTQCSSKQDPRLLLMIDEAQRMTPNNFSYLIDLTNHLEALGMAPTVLLVGQPELLDLRDRLLKMKRKDAVGRFLDNPFVFEGIASEETLLLVLRQYDDSAQAEFPDGSGICITAAYAPRLFAKGLRLEHATSALWAAFRSSARDMNTDAVVGMRNLTRAVEMGLTEIAITGRPEDVLHELWWKQILLEAGFLRHLMTISDRSPS